MTTELEKQFFDTFGIKTKEKSYCWTTYCTRKPSIKFNDCEICRNCKNGRFYTVPEITDKQYLELMCLYTKEIRSFVCYTSNLKMLKEEVLKEFISEKDGFTEHQVQIIFEGER